MSWGLRWLRQIVLMGFGVMLVWAAREVMIRANDRRFADARAAVLKPIASDSGQTSIAVSTSPPQDSSPT